MGGILEHSDCAAAFNRGDLPGHLAEVRTPAGWRVVQDQSS